MVIKLSSQALERSSRHILAVAAAVLYCSWPLGYIFNPVVSRTGLASELATFGQPFYWLFIGADIVSGAIVLLLAFKMWHAITEIRTVRWVRGVIINFGLFGLFTILDALLPYQCIASQSTCPAFGGDPLLLMHGVVGVSAGVCLWISAILLWRVNRKHTIARVGLIVLITWIMLGILAIAFYFIPGPESVSQRYFLALCSIWIVLLPLVLARSTMGLKKIEVANLIR
ncbi:MAG: hypothetical protein NVS1B7_4450 [Candidatus Saccharimonadales bacterium]